jgi:hypothetical protein
MRIRGWLLLTSIFALGLLACNLLIAWKARSGGEELLRSLPRGKTFECILIGNSTMDAGLNLAEFAKAAGVDQSQCLKLAMGGTSAEEECLVLTEFFARDNRTKRVVLGFHDLHLEGNAKHTWSSLSGPFNIIYFCPMNRVQQIYGLSPAESLKVALTSWVPALVRRANLWSKVETLRRSLGGIGMTPVQSTSFGRVADFKFYPFLAKDREEAHDLMGRLAADHAPFSRPLSLILEACKTGNATLTVVEMPLLRDRVALCLNDARWQAFRELRRSGLTAAGANYIRGFEWLGDSEFFRDPVHMTPDGAIRFSARLGTLLTHGPSATSL